MLKSFSMKATATCVLAFMPFVCVNADELNTRSYHLGLLYPNGADIAGYTVESNVLGNVFYFYTFGFPAVASAGLSYYTNHEGNGLVASFGVGLGYLSMTHQTIFYQWKIMETDYLKLGAGYSSTLVYNGAFPVMSYEHRFH